MLTIFEGPPRSGKSRLITELLAKRNELGLPQPLIRKDQPDHHLDGHAKFLRYLAWLHLSYHGDVWLEGAWPRCLIDDYQRHERRLTVAHVRVLERLALTRRTVQVVRLSDDMAEVAVDPRLPTVYSHMTSVSWQTQREIDCVRPLANGGPGVGNWRPGAVVLLVGEGTNNRTRRGQLFLGPFCDVSPNGCSAWLAQQLETSDIDEQELYWVNARRQDGTAESADFVQHLQPTRVVAMGKVAKDWVIRAGVSRADWIDHPQHWRRFHHQEPYPLLSLLRGDSHARKTTQAQEHGLHNGARAA